MSHSIIQFYYYPTVKCYLLFFILCALISIFLSCEDSVNTTIDSTYTCHEEKQWTLDEIRAEIQGKWLWTHRFCVLTGDFPVTPQATFEFNDTSIIIRENDLFTIDVRWFISQDEFGSYMISTQPSTSQITGYLYLCDDRMICSLNPVDACDQYFTRIN